MINEQPPPGWLRRAVAVAAALSAAAVLFSAIVCVALFAEIEFDQPSAALPLALPGLFTLVGAVAAVIAAFAARGRFAPGYGLALLCVAGTTAVMGVGVWFIARQSIPPSSLVGRLLNPWAACTLLLAGGYAAAAAAAVLARRPVALRSLAVGLALATPLGLAAVLGLRFGALSFLTTQRDEPALEILRVTGILVAGVAVIGLVAASAHWCIRAFESTSEPGRPRA